MKRNILLGLILLFVFSCIGENEKDSIMQEEGSVWLSGGLANCAEQIHLDSGDTLIVGNMEDIQPFSTGDRVRVKFKELGRNQSCSSGIDCEILEVKKID